MTKPPCHIGLFVTCLIDLIRPSAAIATIKLLEQAGHQVDLPLKQTCCGQAAYNAGDKKGATQFAKLVYETFHRYDKIIVPSSSCAGQIKNQFPPLLKKTGIDQSLVHQFCDKVFEFSTFLYEGGTFRPPPNTKHRSIVLHSSCSSLRDVPVNDAPQKLLNAIDHYELKPLEQAEVCCGFGGLFSVNYTDLSSHMGRQKLAHIQNTGATTLTSVDMGCLTHLAGLAKRNKIDIDIRSLAEVLLGDFNTPSLTSAQTIKPPCKSEAVL